MYNNKFTSFNEFNNFMRLDEKYLPYDIIELIWKEYAIKTFTNIELIELGLMDIIKKKIENGSVFTLPLYSKDIDTNDCYSIKEAEPTFFDYIAGYGHLDILKKIPNDENITLLTKMSLYMAAINGKIEVVKWLFENRHEFRESNFNNIIDDDIINHSACFGQLEILKWLNNNYGKYLYSYSAMYLAAMNGHSEIVKWLHFNRSEYDDHNIINNYDYYYKTIINFSTITGNIELIKWIYENRKFEYDIIFQKEYNYINVISNSRNVDILEWFYRYKKDLFDLKLIKSIIRESLLDGNVEKLKWLYERFGQSEPSLMSWLKKIINKESIYNLALSSYNLDIIKVVFENIKNISNIYEKISSDSIYRSDKFSVKIPSIKYIEVLKWFIENKNLKISKKFLFKSIRSYKIFKFILKEYYKQNSSKKITKKIKFKLLKIAISEYNIDIMKWIYYNLSNDDWLNYEAKPDMSTTLLGEPNVPENIFINLYILDKKFLEKFNNSTILNISLEDLEWLCKNIPTFINFFKINSEFFFKTALEYKCKNIVEFYLSNGIICEVLLDNLFSTEMYNSIYYYNNCIEIIEFLIQNKYLDISNTSTSQSLDNIIREYLLKFKKNNNDHYHYSESSETEYDLDLIDKYDKYIIERNIILKFI